MNVRDEAGAHRIGGYQPGGATTVYPRGIVRMISKGIVVNVNMHYNPKGEPVTDRTKIALVFARGPIDRVAITAMSGTRDLDIPRRARPTTKPKETRSFSPRTRTSSACCRV